MLGNVGYLCYIAQNNIMIASNELGKLGKESDVTYFKVLTALIWEHSLANSSGQITLQELMTRLE
jgi:L-lactate permease